MGGVGSTGGDKMSYYQSTLSISVSSRLLGAYKSFNHLMECSALK